MDAAKRKEDSAHMRANNGCPPFRQHGQRGYSEPRAVSFTGLVSQDLLNFFESLRVICFAHNIDHLISQIFTSSLAETGLRTTELQEIFQRAKTGTVKLVKIVS